MSEVKNCRWCGGDHGLQCPKVKAIEYFEDGKTIKRIEFFSLPEQMPVAAPWPAPVPFPPPPPPVPYLTWPSVTD